MVKNRVICIKLESAVGKGILKVIYKKKRKNSGPRTEPCGTPQVNGRLSEVLPFAIVRCDLPER